MTTFETLMAILSAKFAECAGYVTIWTKQRKVTKTFPTSDIAKVSEVLAAISQKRAATTKIKFVCPDCGSNDVVMTDVIGLWNFDTQQWEASYDAAVIHCENCYSEHYDLVETIVTEVST